MPPFASKIDASFSTETKSKSSIMASVEAFKSAVVRIRDILRGPGVAITGMDSMRHICLYLLSRYMTKDKVKSLGVPDEFAWENLIETAQTKNGGVQKALDCFFHKETDCLVNHFDRLFGTENFSFDIKNPAKHKEMLEILDKVNMEQIDCQMDVLGWVYEQHLKTGSSAARDLGQFFTDRFICDYMVALCKPGFKSKGVPESVCDPSMGTGGFLTSYMKFYKKHYADKPVVWSVQNKEIHGCDTDPKVAGVARLNLFMESGGNRAVNLRTHDSLYGDLTQTGYDLILANMPFGLKGIKHAECCERVNKLKIRGTKSEPLFLQLMMVSLNRGGRCAVVVPDGMLVNGSTCHDETRKYLLDNFELKRVIKMKGQFFMNTGIQPSILFFENTGKPTSDVEFWDVIKGANGDIEETMVLSVPRAKFDASCSLDMRRYQEVKAVANPAGFPMVKLSDVCDLLSGSANRDNDSGDIPFFASSGLVGMRDRSNYNGEFVITARTQAIGSVSYYDGKLWASDNTILLKNKDITKVSMRFVYYSLTLNKDIFTKIAHTGCIPLIRKSDLGESKILIPPLETQQEIVATLDRIYAPGTTELAETLKLTDKAMDLVLANPGGASLGHIVEAQRLMRKSAQMVADVKAQMVADVKAQMVAVFNTSLKSKDTSWLDISSFCKFERSKIQASKNTPGDYPFISLSVSTHNVNLLDNSEHVFISAIPAGNRKMKVQYQSGECSYSSLMFHCVLDKEKVVPKYFYYYLYYNMDILNEYVIGVQPKFTYESFLSRKITMPTLEVQEDIIRRIGIIESQLSSLENLGKQAEDNARFILDSYLNTA
jgi:restriction endonuclease S subunit